MILPDNLVLTDDDGNAVGMINMPQLQSHATRLMYHMAASAGNDEETDRVGEEWALKFDSPQYFGWVCACALSLMTRHILGPALEVIDAQMPGNGLRAKLIDARDYADQTLGKGGGE